MDVIATYLIIMIIITKLLLPQYPRKESVAYLVQGLGNLIVTVQYKKDKRI